MKALTTVTVAVGLAAGALSAGADAGGVARDGLGGGVVAVESTDGHRFLVTKPAAAAGTGVAGGVVTGTITTRRETDVFNLSVDGDHTFLVTPTPQSADGRINPARGPPAVVTHNTNCWSKDIPSDTKFHYTDERGSDEIAKSNVIRVGMKNRVHITDKMYSPEEASTNLFLGAQGKKYVGRGSHVVMLQVRQGVEINRGNQDNERYVIGSLRPAKILYNGPNNF